MDICYVTIYFYQWHIGNSLFCAKNVVVFERIY